MRAGGSPPATPRLQPRRGATPYGSFNEGRGFTPGDTSTTVIMCDSTLRIAPFNEGRGFTPGDTSQHCFSGPPSPNPSVQ